MIRRMLCATVLAAALAGPASARTYYSFSVGNAPPPPVVVFRYEPDVVLVPRTRVYVVESDHDFDIFRYGGHYYLFDDGYWYRGTSYRGPYRVVNARYVPRSVYDVPQRHWKHHWKQRGYAAGGKGKAKGKHKH